MKNRKIIEQLFVVKNLLNQAGQKKIFFEFGLTVSNYEVLKIIWVAKAKTISDISFLLSESLASSTQKTNKLENMQLVKRTKDKKDSRKKILVVTKKGEKVLKGIEKKIEIVSSLIFLKYSKREKEKFYSMLKDVEKILKKKTKI